jgi:Holliday junction resolvase RusA-like endonuclease
METKMICIQGQIPSKSNSYQPIILGGVHKKARAMLIKKQGLRDWEKDFMTQLLQFKNPKITGHFEISVHVYFRSWASDLDGLFKGVLDCLQKSKWIENDRDCVFLNARKGVDKGRPRIYFKLKTVEKAQESFWSYNINFRENEILNTKQ